MRIEPHIAWRYLVAKKRRNAINIVSGVSCLAVAVVTAAMICVLSVMNGFGEAVEQMFSQLDAELRITPATGKVLALDDERIRSLYTMSDIALIAPTIEESALIEFHGRQVPALLKGVDTTYRQLTALDSIIIDGDYAVWEIGEEYEIDPSEFKTKGRATPFAGERVYGKCLLNVVGGKTVWDAEAEEASGSKR